MNENNTGWIRHISITPPTLQNNTADADRLIGELKTRLNTDAVDIDLYLLKRLPDLLRRCEYNVDCILFKDRKRWLVTGVTHPQDTSPIYGLAVDLGTTRIVLRLIDLSTGRITAETSSDNPQISVGPDILARIHFADQDGGLDRLNKMIIDGLNQMIIRLCDSCKIKPYNIYSLSVAGNTAMTHLFMGLSPHWIIREPYIPVINRPGLVQAKELGIKVNPMARVLIFPNVGSYFGGDLIAGILFSGLNKTEDTAILVDVGTNAEVVLGNRDWLVGCAGAAGPALEGGVTGMGMMAGPGVIDQVVINHDTYNIRLHTIDNMAPKGICGSGLIDLAAHLFLCGMIDIKGKLAPSICGRRLKEKDGVRHLVVAPAKDSGTGSDLTISQADIDSLIRSKAAMYTILETITSSVGISFKDLSTFYVAGTFGSFINPRSAISIGMLPDLPIDRYKFLNNSSIGGATMALTSSECLDEIDNIRDRITYLELNVNQEFMNRFNAARFLPHTDPSLFRSVKVQTPISPQVAN
ncbi:MAG: ASKHA domain-containing protein [Thermodesulfobacteriota bacterium]|nr:ASKHA domain-containing protein [Thermodesulfobacteriota bacterium]